MLGIIVVAATLVPHPIALADGRRFTLHLPAGYAIRVAAEGLRRVRFMAAAPDGRLFVTDMYNRTDNSRGKVYVLDGFDRKSGRFTNVAEYMTGLRNPNSIAHPPLRRRISRDGRLRGRHLLRLERLNYTVTKARGPDGNPSRIVCGS